MTAQVRESDSPGQGDTLAPSAERENTIMENAAKGQTLVFKSAEQLSKEVPESNGRKDDLSFPAEAPRVPEAQGKTFEQIAHESSIETKPSYVEKIPMSVSTAELQSDAMRRLNGRFEEI
jgi:hypothetical protein